MLLDNLLLSYKKNQAWNDCDEEVQKRRQDFEKYILPLDIALTMENQLAVFTKIREFLAFSPSEDPREYHSLFILSLILNKDLFKALILAVHNGIDIRRFKILVYDSKVPMYGSRKIDIGNVHNHEYLAVCTLLSELHDYHSFDISEFNFSEGVKCFMQNKNQILTKPALK
jgi:hypothetical protein